MGNYFATSAAPALLDTHDPCFKWKIHDFSALLQRGPVPISSASFHCSGYNWFLQVTPLYRKKPYSRTPYVALSLGLTEASPGMDLGYVIEAVFELSIYNQSNRVYYGCKASHNFHITDVCSKKECLIPLTEVLNSSDFLTDDCCVFGVEILKIDVFSPEKNPIVVHKMDTAVQNLSIWKDHFIKGTYTLSISNFLKYNTQNCARSSNFQTGGCKWYLSIYPRGNVYSTNCLSVFLHMDSSDEQDGESGKLIEMSVSILDQKNKNHYTRKSPGLVVFAGRSQCGWSDFISLTTFKDPSRGFLLGTRCIIEAEITVIGSSYDG